MCPSLSLPEDYRPYQNIYEWGQALHLHAVIRKNDLQALHELIQVEPLLLTFEDPGDNLCPPLVEAVKLDRLAIIRVLLSTELRYRGTWGTPLTAACARGRLDIVYMLLEGMPDVGIDDVDILGYTPFLCAAFGRMGETRHRLDILRLLIACVANIQAAKAQSLYRNETLEKEIDKDLPHGPFVFKPRPGGGGNALSLAMESLVTDPSVLRFLVEAGVEVFQSRHALTERVDITSGPLKKTGRYKHVTYDRVFITPLAIGSKCGNVMGVKTLLSLFPDDHFRLLATTDAVIVPEPRQTPQFPEDDMPVILPLHAALLGETNDGRPWAAEAVAPAVDVVRVLTANETIRAATINATYRHHCTPLHLATSFDRIPLLLTMMELGADPRFPRHDGHGLILALFSSVSRLSRAFTHINFSWAMEIDKSTDMLAVLQTLLRSYSPRGQDPAVDAQNAIYRRAIINETDANGNTALHFAMAYHLPRSTAALLTLGAQTNVVNYAGQVPSKPPKGTEPAI
ncbi:hypothetical protein SEUCBS139899_010295 [Sporothrix eucalyptigena]|uniref:Ankyrin repeat protein n=1 Tax=Sporothrix eucalyptigena TaxID=1812306 RepID=A0ABP0B980_9PEZI